jgi:hypothetical protein
MQIEEHGDPLRAKPRDTLRDAVEVPLIDRAGGGSMASQKTRRRTKSKPQSFAMCAASVAVSAGMRCGSLFAALSTLSPRRIMARPSASRI